MTLDQIIVELTILAAHKPKWLTPRQIRAISEAQKLLLQYPLSSQREAK